MGASRFETQPDDKSFALNPSIMWTSNYNSFENFYSHLKHSVSVQNNSLLKNPKLITLIEFSCSSSSSSSSKGARRRRSSIKE